MSAPALDIANLELTELESAVESLGAPRFHARQLFQWLYGRGVSDFGEMTDLSRELRSLMAVHFRVETPEVIGNPS